MSFFVLYTLGDILGLASSYALKPLYSLQTFFSSSSATLPVYLRGRTELLNEMADLKEKLSAYSGSSATINRLIVDNEEIRALASVRDTKRIIAGVIARPPRVPYDTLILDSGTSDGIQEGAVVYQAGELAIGFVSRVFPEISLVTLFSSPGVETTVYVFGPDIFTTAYGEGGGVMRISVPQGILLKEGDVVILPSLESGSVGVINKVSSTPTQPEQSGYVVASIPMQSLRLVGVSSRVATPASFDEALKQVQQEKTEFLKIDIPKEFKPDAITATSTGSSTTPEQSTPN